MTRTLLSLALLFLVAVNGACWVDTAAKTAVTAAVAHDEAADKDAVSKTLEQIAEGYSNPAKAKGLLDFYERDFLCFDGGSPQSFEELKLQMEAIQEQVVLRGAEKTQRLFPQSVRYLDIIPEIRGDIAIANYQYTRKTLRRGRIVGDIGWGTTVLIRRGDNWRVWREHFSPAKNLK